MTITPPVALQCSIEDATDGSDTVVLRGSIPWSLAVIRCGPDGEYFDSDTFPDRMTAILAIEAATDEHGSAGDVIVNDPPGVAKPAAVGRRWPN